MDGWFAFGVLLSMTACAVRYRLTFAQEKKESEKWFEVAKSVTYAVYAAGVTILAIALYRASSGDEDATACFVATAAVVIPSIYMILLMERGPLDFHVDNGRIAF